jgi:phospho-N-acetylmuramoyl-pentapeptide-transferase
MLEILARLLEPYFGPFRLLASYLVRIGLGGGLVAVLTWMLLPKLARYLPFDRGRAHAVNGVQSKGKTTGGGAVMLLMSLPILFLVMPLTAKVWQTIACLLLAMLAGYLDDRSATPWGEYRKGMIDLAICLLCGVMLCRLAPITVWLPFLKGEFILSAPLFIVVATLVFWLAINATNCSDGVDGLAGTLSILSLFYLGAFLYIVVGHKNVAAYLLIAHNPDGADWAILVFCWIGLLAGYLWHNAEPSRLLMGDAGSRPLGLLVGIAVMMSGNPFLIVVVAPIVLANGGTGLVKVAMLRLFRRSGYAAGEQSGRWFMRLLHRVRFPLHDHCRRNLGWSNAQVLMRFALLQALLTPLLLVLLLKLR